MNADKTHSEEESVKKTAQKAILHKCYAATKGYYKDDYIKYFVGFENQYPTAIICYTLRVLGCRIFIDRFMELFPNEKVQFVNLGAGFDTISFWVLNKHENVVCYETDFETQLKLKSQIMSDNDCFKQLLTDTTLDNGYVRSERYKMVPFDLTKVNEFDRLVQSGLSPDLPTIFLAEAVFMYIDPDYADKIIKRLSEFCNKASCYICWEFSNSVSNEKFGEFTVKKFKEYNIELLGLKKYKNVEDHVERHKKLGWDDSISAPLSSTWNWMDEGERQRILNIDNFNEMEELATLFTFYMGNIATKNLENPSKFYEFFNKINQNKTQETLEENQSQTLMTIPKKLNVEYFEKVLNDCFKDVNENKTWVKTT